MKAAFIFDTVLALDDKQNYWGMTLNNDFFKDRYLIMFDSIVVVTRVKDKYLVKGAEGYRMVNGENIYVSPINEYNKIPDAIFKKGKIISKLKKIITEVDKVIIRMPSVLGIFASEICRKQKKDYIIEMVACPWDGYKNHTNNFGKIIAPYMYLKTKKCIQKAPKVLYVTNVFLQKRYPTKGKQCACSDVVLREMETEILNKRIENLKGKDFKSLKLCTIANVGMKYKGHKYVFEALSKLKKLGKNYKYYLIGNGDQSYLKKYAQKLKIEDNIFFLGSLPHNEVFNKLEEMDIYIQPSLQEGLPRALIEAMSVGMPAIGSDVGGIPELIDKKMIFKRKKVRDLIKLLNILNEEIMIENAEKNFNEAKRYLSKNLNEKRIKFYKE